MNYCPNCKMIVDEQQCPACGKPCQQEAQNGDFCLLTTCDSLFGEMLEEALLSQKIPCVKIAKGVGIRSAFGLSLENLQIFVPFGQYTQAKEIFMSFATDADDEKAQLRTSLLENLNDWFVEKTSKEDKMKKKLGLSKEDDLFLFCGELVEQAENLQDQGLISSCPACGHYIAVSKDGIKLLFNSETFELLDVQIKKK